MVGTGMGLINPLLTGWFIDVLVEVRQACTFAPVNTLTSHEGGVECSTRRGGPAWLGARLPLMLR